MSGSAVLISKLAPPAAYRAALVRSQLVPLIVGPQAFPLTVVIASPGYGKTTLLAEAVRTTTCPAAWLTHDAGDNDPVRWFQGLIAAMQQAVPGFAQELDAQLQAPQPPAIQAMLIPFVNRLAALEQPVLLVLDDLDQVSDAVVHQSLKFLVEHVPSQVQLVLGSRAELPFSLSRARSQGALRELGVSDLRLTVAEARQLLNDRHALGLDDEQVERLYQRTEGWPAGLQLAAVSLRDSPDRGQFVDQFTGNTRHIMDFLMDEVLSRLPDDVQQFLLQTSVLESFNASLCDAVTGRSDGAARIAELEQKHVFLLNLDQARVWYRYHTLFATLLRERLQASAPELVPALHVQACRWYMAQGLLPEAMRHAIASGDFDRVANLIEQGGHLLLAKGRFKTVVEWLHLLPEDKLYGSKVLAITDAWCQYFTANALGVEKAVSAVEKLLQQTRAEDFTFVERVLIGQVALLRSYQYRYGGDIHRAMEHTRIAREHIPREHISYDGVLFHQGVCHLVLNQLDEAQKLFSEQAMAHERSSTLLLSTTSVFNLARIQLLQGRLIASQALLDDAMGRYRKLHWHDTPAAGVLYVGLGEVHLEKGDLTQAEQYFTAGLDLADNGGLEFLQGWGAILLGQLRVLRGDRVQALPTPLEAGLLRFWARIRNDSPRISVYLARLWLMENRLDEAWEWAQTLKLTGQAPLAPELEAEHVLLARMLMQKGELDQALDLLTQLLVAAEAGRRNGVVLEVLILQAMIRHAQGQTKQAISTVQRAIQLGEPEGYVRLFIEEGEPMADLLERYTQQVGDNAYVSRLQQAAAQCPVRSLSLRSGLATPLSQKEERVCRYLVAGLSNQEIADKLFVSHNTIKTHLKNVYTKLGVSSRMEAVQKIRDLNLL